MSMPGHTGASHTTECGLPGLATIPYGVHMCHFYETRAELAAALVPYFVAGLRKQERCIWITAQPLDAAAAAAELRDAGLTSTP
jgi:two-component system, sensor histidine kinase PdtaS